MNDDIAIVQEAMRAAGWGVVAPAIGIKPKRGERIRCPIHNGDDRNFTLDERDGRLTWVCSSRCGAGDALELVQRLRGLGFREALAECASIVGVVLGGQPDDNERRAEERAAYLGAARAREAEPTRAKPPPDPQQSAAMWDAAMPITDDQEAAAVLASRAIDPIRCRELDLVRALRPGQPMPSWATYKGRTWLETGHRILLQTADVTGARVGLRAWRVGGDEDTPKRLPQAGYSARGLVLANERAVAMLRDGVIGLLVVSEGEPDMLVHAVRNQYAVVGITSGSWTQSIADRIAFGSEVVIRTDNDQAGEKYAAHIRETLKGRVTAWRNVT